MVMVNGERRRAAKHASRRAMTFRGSLMPGICVVAGLEYVLLLVLFLMGGHGLGLGLELDVLFSLYFLPL